jgi:hypothetical protein
VNRSAAITAFDPAVEQLAHILERPDMEMLSRDVTWSVCRDLSASFEITKPGLIRIDERTVSFGPYPGVTVRHALELNMLLQSGKVHPAAAAIVAARTAWLFARLDGWQADADMDDDVCMLISLSPPRIADLQRTWMRLRAHQPHCGAELPESDAQVLIDCWCMLGPVELLLEMGGDVRLRIDSATGLNAYGCSHRPRPWAITFASTTASSVSERGYLAAESVRRRITLAALRGRGPFSLMAEASHVRHAIRDYYGLPSGSEVVLAASGTDCELFALAIVQSCADGKPITNILIAPEESGSGVPFAALGRHFAIDTARGVAVQKGVPIAGFDPRTELMVVSLDNPDGSTRAMQVIDDDCERAVANGVAAGRHVLIHRLDVSKLGRAAPGCARLKKICARYGDNVHVVVDACQARLSAATMRACLEEGWIVLVTGSKFFTGPPFAGAVLLPQELAARINTAELAGGLRDYSVAADWPPQFGEALTQTANYGLILRWRAALSEMEAFASVPPQRRREILELFCASVRQMVSAHKDLVLLSVPPLAREAVTEDWDAVGTIMSFGVLSPEAASQERKLLGVAEARQMYEWLNADLTSVLPQDCSGADFELASRRCHIGQPVPVTMANGAVIGALRIAAGARLVSGEPSHSGLGETERVNREIADAGIILEKIALILREYRRLQAANPRPSFR